MEVTINGFSFSVQAHVFWRSFNADWELATKALYNKYTVPNKSILDVGAWIGPTVLIGYANNAKHIYAIEADPVNAHILNINCRKNFIENRVTIINKCIYPKSNEILSFGNCLSPGDSSTATLSGARKVEASTLMGIIEENKIDVSDISILKVDIEGSELFLVRDLKHLSQYKNLVVLLSLHQKFWDKIPAKPTSLQILFEYYDFFTEKEALIDREYIGTYIMENVNCLVVLKPKYV